MKKKKTISIIIADDHPLLRAGVRVEIGKIQHFNVLAETGNGKEALDLITTLKPDIAIIDFQMPEMNGLEIVKNVEAAGHTTKTIILTMHRDRKIFFSVLDAGANGYVLKDEVATEITKAIERVAEGELFISRDMIPLLINKGNKRVVSEKRDLDRLTPTEEKILALIAEFKSNDEIAEELFISKRTVENHKVSIADKLGLRSAKHLLRYALKNME